MGDENDLAKNNYLSTTNILTETEKDASSPYINMWGW